MGFATTYKEYTEQQDEEWSKEIANLDPNIQPLWQSDYGVENSDKQCHETLTLDGFLVYIMARNLLFDDAESGFQLSDLQLLSEESAYPDKVGSDQVGFIYAGHFYDPDTMENYAGSKTTTARTNGQLYYDNAVMFYKEGKRTEAIKNLAYSIHYIQDVGVPHHAANKKIYRLLIHIITLDLKKKQRACYWMGSTRGISREAITSISHITTHGVLQPSADSFTTLQKILSNI